MRILHITPSLSARAGGATLSVVSAALALRSYGLECVIASTDLAGAVTSRTGTPIAKEDIPDGAESVPHILFPIGYSSRLAYAPSMGLWLRRHLHEFDVLHVHNLWLYPQFAAGRAARRIGKPYIVSPCGGFAPPLRSVGRRRKAATMLLWQRRMLNEAAGLHYKTAGERAESEDLLLEAPAFVAPNGLDVTYFQQRSDPAHFRQRFGLPPSAPVVGFIGRIAYKKRIPLVIEAFARVRQRVPSAWLMVAGPDDEGLLPELRRCAASAGVAECTAFTGMLRGLDRVSGLAACTVWALPSLHENFGTACVEAMAAGVATVVSPGVALSGDLLASGAALVEDPTSPRFADAIAGVLLDRSRRSDLARLGKIYAEQFDWGVVGGQWASMYRAVADGSRRGTGGSRDAPDS